MVSREKMIEMCRVPAGKRISLKDYDPAWAGDEDVPKGERKQLAREVLGEDTLALAEAQEVLYAADSWSILIIFQAMDAAGKDSTIKHVMSGINPQGVDVRSFKHPSPKELDHNFLWRYARALPDARAVRHLQPVVFRRCPHRQGSPRACRNPAHSQCQVEQVILGTPL